MGRWLSNQISIFLYNVKTTDAAHFVWNTMLWRHIYCQIIYIQYWFGDIEAILNHLSRKTSIPGHRLPLKVLSWDNTQSLSHHLNLMLISDINTIIILAERRLLLNISHPRSSSTSSVFPRPSSCRGLTHETIIEISYRRPFGLYFNLIFIQWFRPSNLFKLSNF